MRIFVTALALGIVTAAFGCDAPGPVRDVPAATSASSASASESGEDSATLPVRQGSRPDTSDAPDGTNIAHEQKTQTAPRPLQEALLDRVRTLPGITIGRSFVSVQGARAFHLDRELANGPPEAFAVRTEFGHLHPPHDGSLHLNPDPELRKELIEKGWAEPHPRSSRTVMVYGPRDEAELEVVWSIVRRCYERAAGL